MQRILTYRVGTRCEPPRIPAPRTRATAHSNADRARRAEERARAQRRIRRSFILESQLAFLGAERGRNTVARDGLRRVMDERHGHRFLDVESELDSHEKGVHRERIGVISDALGFWNTSRLIPITRLEHHIPPGPNLELEVTQPVYELKNMKRHR